MWDVGLPTREPKLRPSSGSGSRTTSLPPLRNASVGELSAATTLPTKLQRGYPFTTTAKQWTGLKPRRTGRPADLFNFPCYDLQDAPGIPFLARTTTGSMRLGDEQSRRQSRTDSDVRQPKRKSTHLTTVKAVYLSNGGSEYKGSSAALEAALQAGNGSAQVVDADKLLKREVAGLRTGADAVAFFTKHGTNTSVKLLYCNRSCSGTAAKPYDLIVVPKESAQQEHFIISPSGVVYFKPGQLSEYTSLADWTQQSSWYRMLTSMRFFRFYVHNKVIALWRLNARHQAYCRNRQQLARNCFLTKPMFVPPMMQVRGLVREIKEVQVLRIPDNCCQLHEFVNMQKKIWSNPMAGAQGELEQKQEQIVRVLETLANNVFHVAGEAGPFALESAGSRSKSMHQEKQEERERKRLLHVARQDQERLSDCIRLVDCMLQGAMTSLVRDATFELHQRVHEGTFINPLKPLFTVSVSLDANGVAFNPSCNTFALEFERLWHDPIRSLDSIPPILSSRSFQKVIRTRGHRTSVGDFLRNDASWVQWVEDIKISVEMQLRNAFENACTMYEPCLRIMRHSEEWDETSVQTQKHTLESLSRQMELLAQFQDDLAALRNQRPVGIILLDARRLKENLSLHPESAQVVLKNALLSLAHESCIIVESHLDSMSKILDDRPKAQASFEQFKQAYKAVLEQQSAWEESFDEVECMYQLLLKYHVRPPAEDQLRLDMVQAKYQTFTNKTVPEVSLFIERYSQQQRTSMTMTLEVPWEETTMVTGRLLATQEELSMSG